MPLNQIFSLQPTWPAASLPADPPSVEDAQTAPTATDLLPQVVALTPRGAAWGTDEVGNINGCSPIMASFWLAIAKWVADLNVRESEVAAQAFPSAVTIALADWEAELGLPDAKTPLAATTAARLATVRVRACGVSALAPADFIGLAAFVGATITIEEPDQFQVDVSEVGPGIDDPSPAQSDFDELAMLADVTAWRFWVVRVVARGPFSTNAELIRALQPLVPLHTEMVLAA